MDRANDDYLRLVVSAEEADENDRYRYSCLCCGEQVYVAAAERKKQRTHFRHFHGNNGNAECENYVRLLPQSMRKISSQKQKENINFYYKSTTQTLFAAVKLSELDISNEEKLGAKYEIRTAYASRPFYTCLINHTFFSSEAPTYIHISEYAPSYYCGVSSQRRKAYEIFRKEKLSILKISGDPAEEFEAKVVLGSSLYTKTAYLLLSRDSEFEKKICELPTVEVCKIQDFTVGKYVFSGRIVYFKEKTEDLDFLLKSYNYRLEIAETLSVLWPPMRKKNGGLTSDADEIFLTSSFRLISRSNTNADIQDITYISRDLSKVALNRDIKVLCKNAEILVTKEPVNNRALIPVQANCIRTDSFFVPSDGTFYLYASDGIRKLNSGETIYLCNEYTIRQYIQTYNIASYSASTEENLGEKEKLSDMLRNYRVVIPYNKNLYSHEKENGTIAEYLKECEKTGLINLAIARMLKEDNT